MTRFLPVIILILSGFAYGQSDLPEYGKLSDIKDKTKIYVIAEGEARTAMLKTIDKQSKFSIIEKPEAAEIFIEYKMISRGTVPPTGMTLETGQMNVFYYRETTKVIAWSDSAEGGGFRGDTANRLLKKFLKAVEKKK